jgi:SAM-dependent methyltransferase
MVEVPTDTAALQGGTYAEIAQFYDDFVGQEDRWLGKTAGYHGLVTGIYRALIPRGQRVLEIGCGRGDLLAALEPRRGVGVDVSSGMIEAAAAKHPNCEFAHAAGESFRDGEVFDYVVLSDLVPYVHDLQALFATVAMHSHPRTRVVLNTYSNVWRPALAVLQRLGLRPPRPVRNWVAPRDLTNLLELAGFEVLFQRNEILLPAQVPGIARFINGIAARLPVLRALTVSYWLIARPASTERAELSVSVVVPCRNEAGNIDDIVHRVPDMGVGTEIVFVEGHSQDDTADRIRSAMERRQDRDLRFLQQTGNGKGNAVQEAFEVAKGDVLMILDADLTVAPEDLPRFYEALVSGRGDVINGTRLVYGMEPGAMRFLNMLGNKAFAAILSVVLGQYVKDTLCGTKALYKSDYDLIAANRHEFEEHDPFGDFDLLLGASLLGLKILNVPVRYGARVYGDTNIQRFSDGGLLARLAVAGYRRIWVRPIE